jgi:uncharacterized membrane protein (DUF4010 family)
MSDIELLARLILCLALGAILGLETETRFSSHTSEAERSKTEKARLGGLRTYMILSLFGGLSGVMFAQGYPIFAYLMFIAIAVVVLAAYVLNVQYRKAFGLTTEIAVLITVLLSFAVTAQIMPLQILLGVALILALILSQKRGVGALISKIQHQELEDIVKFLIVVFVIWPFLPDKNFMLGDLAFLSPLYPVLHIPEALMQSLVVFNPFKLWQYVLLISGINLLGYFAAKGLGSRRGQLLSSIFGGFVSSTSTTVAFATRSKGVEKGYLRKFAAYVLIANAVSFLPLTIIAVSVDVDYASQILPLNLLFSATSLIAAFALLAVKQAKPHQTGQQIKYEPFSLGPALQFVLLLTLVRVGVQVAQFYLGDTAFILTTALSGALGVDVALISIGEVASAGAISLQLAAITYIAVNTVNYIAKVLYSYMQGKSLFARLVASGLAFSMITTGLIYLGLVLSSR